MLELLSDYAGWIVAIAGASVTAVAVLRKTGRKVGAGVKKLNDVSDVMLGRPAILHPETGEELVPETPGIGARMAHMERWQDSATGILASIADTQQQMARTNSRVDELGIKLNKHLDKECVGPACATAHVEVTLPS